MFLIFQLQHNIFNKVQNANVRISSQFKFLSQRHIVSLLNCLVIGYVTEKIMLNIAEINAPNIVLM